MTPTDVLKARRARLGLDDIRNPRASYPAVVPGSAAAIKIPTPQGVIVGSINRDGMVTHIARPGRPPRLLTDVEYKVINEGRGVVPKIRQALHVVPRIKNQRQLMRFINVVTRNMPPARAFRFGRAIYRAYKKRDHFADALEQILDELLRDFHEVDPQVASRITDQFDFGSDWELNYQCAAAPEDLIHAQLGCGGWNQGGFTPYSVATVNAVNVGFSVTTFFRQNPPFNNSNLSVRTMKRVANEGTYQGARETETVVFSEPEHRGVSYAQIAAKPRSWPSEAGHDSPKPELAPYASAAVEVSPGGVRRIPPPTKHTRTPPAPGTKEIKVKASKGFPLPDRILYSLSKGLANLTEIKDFVDSIYEAIPEKIRKEKYKGATLHQKVAAIYNEAHNIDWNQAVINLIYNHYEDKIIGGLHAGAQKNLPTPIPGRDRLTGGRGLTWGPAFSGGG